MSLTVPTNDGPSLASTPSAAQPPTPRVKAPITDSSFRRWMRLEFHARGRGVWSVPLMIWTIALAVLAGYAASHPIWLMPWGALAATALVGVFMAPFAMFWRNDARIWQRLALPQRAMFDVTLIQQARRCAWLFAPMVILAFLHRQNLWQLVIVVATYAWVVGAGSAAVFFGGVMVASDKADALVDTMAGEFRPPRVVWLGALPAIVGGVVLLLIILIANGVPRLSLALGAGGVVALAAVLLLVARAASAHQFARALTEVVALDRQSLAHVEVLPLSPLEGLWCRLWPGAHRPLLRTTFLVLRRRFPMRGMWLALAVGAVAAAGWLGWPRWLVAVVGLLVLALLDASRVASRDITLPRLASALGVRGEAAMARIAAISLHLTLFSALAVVLIAAFGTG